MSAATTTVAPSPRGRVHWMRWLIGVLLGIVLLDERLAKPTQDAPA